MMKYTFKQSCVKLCTYGFAGIGVFQSFIGLGRWAKKWKEKWNTPDDQERAR